uniref:Transcription initiation factor TFIID subunit 8 n=1 Tax=Anopheles dirus TaxID=7168 RepID=A0A182N3R5_9DIPT
MTEVHATQMARRRFLTIAISSQLEEAGFSTAEKDALETLTEMMQSFLVELGNSARNYCELAGRTQPVIGDVVVALINMGISIRGLDTFAKREGRHVLAPPQQAQAQKQQSILQAGQKISHPSHIPNHLPAFPDPHAYIRTPTHKQPVTEYEVIREKAAQQQRDVERALTKFLAKTSEIDSLFDNEESPMFPLIACKPSFPPYLQALNPSDQIFDFEELEYYYLVANRKEDITETKEEADAGDDDDDEDGDTPKKEEKGGSPEVKQEVDEVSSPAGGKSESPAITNGGAVGTSAATIDNPYLRAATIPRKTAFGASDDGSRATLGSLLCETLRLLDDLLDRADHVKGDLRQMVELTVQDLGEALDGFLQRHELAGVAGEHLGHLERLRQEALDLAGACHRQLVLLGQLIHTQDGDDVLERLVVLQDLLHATGDVVVLGTDDVRVHDTRRRVERIDRRVDAQLGDGTRQHGRGVQVSERGGRSRIGQIVSRHVDGLHGRDRTLLRRGDALLHAAHVRGQRRLVTDSGRDTTEQGRHLRTGLREAEDVVDEQQHILTLLVTEVLGHSETGQGDTGTGARRLVHLAVHQRHLRRLVLQRDDTTLNHLVVQIVTLAGALSDAGEHGVTTVRLGHVVDQLHDKYGLADTGTTEQTDLTALGVRGQQIHHLDARYQDLLLDAHLDELGRLGVDGRRQVRVDRATLIDRLADHVDDTAERFRTHGDTDRRTGVVDPLSTHQTLRTVHGDRAHGVLTQMLRNLQHQPGRAVLHLQRVQDRRQLLVELHVHDGTDDGHDLALGAGGRLCRCLRRVRSGHHLLGPDRP